MNATDRDVTDFRRIAFQLFDGTADAGKVLRFFALGWATQIDTSPPRWIVTEAGSRQLDAIFIWPAVSPSANKTFVGTIRAMGLKGPSQIDGRTVAAGAPRPSKKEALEDARAMAARWVDGNPILRRRDLG